jgi:hypothetical protein
MPTIPHDDSTTQQRTAVHRPTRSRDQADRWIEAEWTSVALSVLSREIACSHKRAMCSLCVEMKHECTMRACRRGCP